MTISETTGIALTPPANLRDLGGTPVATGVVSRGLALRADDLSTIDELTAQRLVDDGLTTVIDLRTSSEVAFTGRGPLAHHFVSYHHIPFMSSVDSGMSKEKPTLDHERMGEMYLGMVEHAAPQIATALTIIALSKGTTAFHCTAGRDRTGTLAAMLLLCLGADDETIVADYVKTDQNMAGIMARTSSVMGHLMERLGFDLEEMTRDMTLNDGKMAISMRIMLGRLRERHGDPLAPLREAGLSDDTIARLRARAGVTTDAA